MTLGLAKTRGKRLRRQMVKPKLGLAGGVLFKANCQGGPINHPTRLGIPFTRHFGNGKTRPARPPDSADKS